MTEIILLSILIFLAVITLTFIILLLVKKSKSSSFGNTDEIKRIIKDNNDILIQNSDTQFKNLTNRVIEIEKNNQEFKDKFNKDFNDSLDRLNKTIKDNSESSLKSMKESLDSFKASLDSLLKDSKENHTKEVEKLNQEFKSINDLLFQNNTQNIKSTKEALEEFRKSNNEKLEKIETTIKDSLENIRKDNSDKLDQIKGVVDEKLQKTLEEKLNQSFKNVFEQISNLNTTIGQIQTLATDVSSLKNVFANAKTKGIVGEVVLGNLIRDILTESQFDENVATKKGSTDRVEYAIKLPGNGDETIYLPIDSKFPTESYNKILDAIDKADKDALDEARKELARSIKNNAKDISSKYIDEPNTTGFAIMFLPIEGLYSEVINLGLFEEIQNTYKVIIAGPSTFSALLNALQMGFKTLVIQKKSAEVFQILSAVKTEFNTFADALTKTQTKFEQANNELEKLVGTRTRAMQRKLKDVEEVPGISTSEILGIKESNE